MARRRSVVALLLASVAVTGSAADAVDRFPGAGDAYLVVLDGRVLWAHAPDARHAPASLTKLLAALVLVDDAWRPDAWVIASRNAAAQRGSRAGLGAGDALTAGDALVAMLVASANDACVALAEHAAGSVKAFAARMNARATALGLASTHVTSPCGLDAPGHHSTARDLWRLTEAALERPEIRRIVALPAATIRTRQGRVLALRNGNALLGRLDGVEGVKTGFTSRAGRCVIVLARRRGHEVLVVLLGARTGWPDRWWTSVALVEAAFTEAAPP